MKLAIQTDYRTFLVLDATRLDSLLKAFEHAAIYRQIEFEGSLHTDHDTQIHLHLLQDSSISSVSYEDAREPKNPEAETPEAA